MNETIFEKNVNDVIDLILIYATNIYGEEIKKHIDNPTELFADPEFSRKFISRGFEGFKKAQDIILESTLFLEKEIKDFEKKGNLDYNDSFQKLHYQKLVFQELADAILWSVVSEETAITNLSVKNANSGFLVDRNIQSVKLFIKQYNKELYQFALISDLTSIVGVGDVIQVWVDKKGVMQWGLGEVKTGEVSKTITDLYEDDERGELTEEHLKERLKKYYLKYGQKWMKQFERFSRQMVRSAQYKELLKEGEGIDLYFNKPKKIHELSSPDQYYTSQINSILDEFYKKENFIELFKFDNLVFGFIRQADDGRGEMTKRLNFKHYLYHDFITGRWDNCCYLGEPMKQEEFEKEFTTYQKLSIHELREKVKVHFIRPIFLSGLKIQYLRDFIFRKLSIFIYFDSDEFIKNLEKRGMKVILTKKGGGDATDRDFFKIGDKFIRIEKPGDPHGWQITLGARPILKSIFGFKTIGSVLDQIEEGLNKMNDLKTTSDKRKTAD